MDDLLVSLLTKLSDGGPLALGAIAALFIVLWFIERRATAAAVSARFEDAAVCRETIKELNDVINALTREAVGAMKDTAAAVNRVADSGEQIREGLTKVADAVSRGRRA